MIKIFTFILLVALFRDNVISQSYQGLRTSRYAGIIGATLHPASIESYPGKFDMAILGINLYGENNYGKVSRDRSFFNFSYDDFKGSLIRDGNSKHAFLSNDVMVLAFMFKTKKWGTFGLIPRVRTFANADNISSQFANALADGFENSKLFKINYLNQNANLIAMSWQEYGITWAKKIKENNRRKITLGVTPKLLIGNGAAFYKFHTDQFSNIGAKRVTVDGFKFEYGYSDNMDQIPGEDYKWRKGNKFNFGLDIGIEYTHYSKNQFDPSFSKYLKLYKNEKKLKHNYKYKVSLSLLDLGRVRYTYGKHSASSVETLPAINSIDVGKLKGKFNKPDELKAELERMLLLTPSTGTFTLGLPTTLQTSIDYHLKGRFFLNGNMGINMRPLKLSDHEVHDLTHLTITPRWESRLFDVYSPLYTNLNGTANLGLGMRIGPLAFGISDFLLFLTRKEVTSNGFYFVIKTYVGKSKPKKGPECAPGAVWKK